MCATVVHDVRGTLEIVLAWPEGFAARLDPAVARTAECSGLAVPLPSSALPAVLALITVRPGVRAVLPGPAKTPANAALTSETTSNAARPATITSRWVPRRPGRVGGFADEGCEPGLARQKCISVSVPFRAGAAAEQPGALDCGAWRWCARRARRDQGRRGFPESAGQPAPGYGAWPLAVKRGHRRRGFRLTGPAACD